ncbi:MAG TPA: winged helix-turn-helix domain-containing protein [Caulobacteraceae bacterium]|jgi:Tol biopolymer transport system component/DNA-binding winged helix-turn-helix (wHTH) protein
MNELFSPLRRRVDLALAGPFSLGSLRVHPIALEVHGPEGVQTLEPRVMQVLVALHQARGEPVSRDDLCELCWEGRIVGEDALNRCIGRLRKALAAEPRAAIDTIPKIGYRLRVPPMERMAAERPPADESRPAPAASRRPPRVALLLAAGLGAVAVLGVGAAAWNRLRAPAAWSAEGVRPLTAEPGVETHPALSPDGRFLAYAAGPSSDGPRDLFLKNVSEGAPLRLTSEVADESAPAWSPAGDRIAFVRQTGGEPCRIVVLPVPRGAERTVGRCSMMPSTGLAWLDERTILLSDRSRPDEVARIRALDTETGALRNVTRPGAETLGDSDPLASPDGRSVVFRRSASNGVDYVYLADARTGAERPLTRDGWKALGYAWAADGRTLFYASNRGGDWGLWTIDTRRTSEPKRVSLGLMSLGRMSSDRSGKLAVETSDRRRNLFAVGGAGAPVALTASTGREWDPDVAQHGGLVFVSDQGGAPEVWVRPDGGEPARLTRLGASYVHSTRWSPDGRRIAFIAARGRGTDLWLMNADGSGLARVTQDGASKVDPVWDADGRALVYVERRGQVRRLLRVSASGGEPVAVPGGAGFRALRPGWDGAFYGERLADDRLWRLPRAGGVATPVSPTLRVGEDSDWTTGRLGIYQVRGRATPAPTLWLRTWSGAERKLADLPSVAAIASPAVDPRTGAFIFPRKLREEYDIALLDVRSRS